MMNGFMTLHIIPQHVENHKKGNIFCENKPSRSLSLLYYHIIFLLMLLQLLQRKLFSASYTVTQVTVKRASDNPKIAFKI